MAAPGSNIDVGSAFHDIIAATHPSAKFSSFSAKQLSGNTRVLLPPDAGAAENDKGTVLKLKKVTLVAIPRNKYAPLVVSTHRKGMFIIGARLTPHGGEIAVELARKIVKKAGMRLLVLGTNIIALFLLDTASMSPRAVDVLSASQGTRTGEHAFIEASVEKLRKITDEFYARIDALLS